jgi:3D (Asp-Asp-Asp) domain-containing protein
MNSIFAAALAGLLLSNGVGQADALQGTAETVQLPTYSVKMTAYNAVPAQTDDDPFTTASGAFSNPEIVAARSVDLKEDLPWGTVIEIVGVATPSTNCGFSVVEEHIGYRVIADSMHSRKRNQIDILLDHEERVQVGKKKINPAVAMGICDNVEIRVVGKINMKEMPKTQRELTAMIGMGALAVNQ